MYDFDMYMKNVGGDCFDLNVYKGGSRPKQVKQLL